MMCVATWNPQDYTQKEIDRIEDAFMFVELRRAGASAGIAQYIVGAVSCGSEVFDDLPS